MDIKTLSKHQLRELHKQIGSLFKEEDELKDKLRDHVNQMLILLKDIPLPVIDEEYDSYGGQATYLTVDFKHPTHELSKLKVVLEAIANDLDKNKDYLNDSSKMARAYYTSFCNG